MRARADWLIGLAACLVSSACTRDNPAFDQPVETEGHETLADGTDEDDDQAELADESSEEQGPMLCGLQGGKDMNIKVPQPCGETNDELNVYEHWFKVVEAGGSTWTVQFCSEACGECEPIAADLVVAPLPVAELAGPDACLKMAGRRLGSGDDCSYHAISIIEPGAAGRVVVLARRTELLEIPGLASGTNLLGFNPQLSVADSCDCGETPDSCCGDQSPTLYDFQVEGAVIPVGENQIVTLGQNTPYRFWAFDAFNPGECNAGTRIAWALTTNQ
jgi:hypothetical protein